MRHLRKLKTFLGRLHRDLGRKLDAQPGLCEISAETMKLSPACWLRSPPTSASSTPCTRPRSSASAKATARTRWEFGVKVLVWALNEAGRANVVIVDHFGTGDKWRNIAKRDFFEIVTIDGLPAWLDKFGREVEAVFHLGANASTTERDADDPLTRLLFTVLNSSENE